MNEKEKEAIKKEAKQILDNFAEALSRIKVGKNKIKSGLGGFREEGKGSVCDSAFRKAMLANAPETEGEYLVAEKKKW